MKKIILPVLMALVFTSCEKKEKTVAVATPKAEEKEIYQNLYGSWVGDFIAEEYDDEKSFVHVNKLNIVLKRITATQVIGQSIVAGNVRPLKGEILEYGKMISFTLEEPGEDKYDGKFTFELLNDSLVGTWTPFNKNMAVTKRKFKLAKKEFIYDPTLMLPEEGEYVDWENPKVIESEPDEDGEKYAEDFYRTASEQITILNASTEKLDEETLKNLKKLDLEIIRNTIFARHGYTFKKKTLRQFFDPVAWYIPVSNNIDGQLTALEKENIALLKRFEKYAEDNYDTFGR